MFGIKQPLLVPFGSKQKLMTAFGHKKIHSHLADGTMDQKREKEPTSGIEKARK